MEKTIEEHKPKSNQQQNVEGRLTGWTYPHPDRSCYLTPAGEWEILYGGRAQGRAEVVVL